MYRNVVLWKVLRCRTQINASHGCIAHTEGADNLVIGVRVVLLCARSEYRTRQDRRQRCSVLSVWQIIVVVVERVVGRWLSVRMVTIGFQVGV